MPDSLRIQGFKDHRKHVSSPPLDQPKKETATTVRGPYRKKSLDCVWIATAAEILSPWWMLKMPGIVEEKRCCCTAVTEPLCRVPGP
ncbi:hypothetical protein GE061_019725 [Apolygus lucorum]|uniref:Uncharacterized protein n=1 Tax=Apolygus lucorum TaxID=248454 RepID=A0A8S9X972_APOLU|nr:hypothetical protein GE061_019725 [Apolygus lucorum]